MNGSQTALQLSATDSLHTFSFPVPSFPSEEPSEQKKPQACFPLEYFTSPPSIKALCPIKVDGIMSWPRPFRGVPREGALRQSVFVCVVVGEKVCECTVYYSCRQTEACVVCV